MNIDDRKEELLAKLFNKQRAGIKPGLERTLELAKFAGNPHNNFKSIHIAGSNGKGTICSVLSSLLKEYGLKTGLYTSPHISKFNERINVNGELISDEKLVEYADLLLPKADEIEATFFEITTVMAFLHFDDMGVDIAVIETGMGGRFDSTNILMPTLTAISDIDMDHKEYLGDTIEKISYEKAGIIKNNIPVVITKQDKKAEKVIIEKAHSMDSKLIYAQEYATISKKIENRIKEQFISDVFLKNFQVAQTLFELYTNSTCSYNLVDKALKNIKNNTGYYGRLQLLEIGQPVILDISHTTAAISNLIESVKTSYPEIERWNIVIALMKDKDLEGIIRLLSPITNKLFVTESKNERSAKCEQLHEIAMKEEINSAYFNDCVEATNIAIKTKNPTIITGSFYLAGEIIDHIEF